MGILSSIAGLGIGEIAKGVGSLAKDLRSAFTGDISPEDRAKLEQTALTIETLGRQLESKDRELQSNVIIAEAKSESWIAGNWRPITMLSFVAIIVNNYILAPYIGLFFGDQYNLVLEIPPKMWSLLQIGIGGYIVSRGAEKISGNGGIASLLGKKD